MKLAQLILALISPAQNNRFSQRAMKHFTYLINYDNHGICCNNKFYFLSWISTRLYLASTMFGAAGIVLGGMGTGWSWSCRGDMGGGCSYGCRWGDVCSRGCLVSLSPSAVEDPD